MTLEALRARLLDTELAFFRFLPPSTPVKGHLSLLQDRPGPSGEETVRRGAPTVIVS